MLVWFVVCGYPAGLYAAVCDANIYIVRDATNNLFFLPNKYDAAQGQHGLSERSYFMVPGVRTASVFAWGWIPNAVTLILQAVCVVRPRDGRLDACPLVSSVFCVMGAGLKPRLAFWWAAGGSSYSSTYHTYLS